MTQDRDDAFHGGAHPSVSLEEHFPCRPQSVIEARRFVDRGLRDVPTECSALAVLLTSELTTNSVVHAHSSFDVIMERFEEKVRITVADSGGGRPTVQKPGSPDGHGWGLRIVDALSVKWGIDRATDDVGKSVWFTLDAVGASPLL